MLCSSAVLVGRNCDYPRGGLPSLIVYHSTLLYSLHGAAHIPLVCLLRSVSADPPARRRESSCCDVAAAVPANTASATRAVLAAVGRPMMELCNVCTLVGGQAKKGEGDWMFSDLILLPQGGGEGRYMNTSRVGWRVTPPVKYIRCNSGQCNSTQTSPRGVQAHAIVRRNFCLLENPPRINNSAACNKGRVECTRSIAQYNTCTPGAHLGDRGVGTVLRPGTYAHDCPRMSQ